MSLRTLFDIGMSFAVFGGILFVLFLSLFLIGNRLIFKKSGKKEHKFSFTRILWWGMFLCYVFVVLGVTLLMRSRSLVAEPVYPPFYSYRDAWAHWSSTSWSNIILNFCMFVPLGFLLPLGFSYFRLERRILLWSFSCSLIIELTQLISRKGMFEWDDLLGNTMGALIGYGFYLLMVWIGHHFSKARLRRKNIILTDEFTFQGKKGGWKVLFAQFPLLITVCAFTFIFMRYDRLEIGISPDSYITPYDNKLIQVSSGIALSDRADAGMVYSARILTPEDATAFAERFYSNLGTHLADQNSRPYENLIVTCSEDGKRSLWVDYKGGTFHYTDYSLMYPEGTAPAPAPVENASQEEITAALLKYGIALPDKATSHLSFRELSEDYYEPGWYEITMDAVPTREGILLGTLSCQYYGEAGFGSISNQISENRAYKEYPLLSEQEAYEQIAAGKFNYIFGKDTLNIQIQGDDLIYVLDSKGYYQPTYEFNCSLNGRATSIRIPAIKN